MPTQLPNPDPAEGYREASLRFADSQIEDYKANLPLSIKLGPISTVKAFSAITVQSMTLSAVADLNSVTFSYTIASPSAPANVVVQMFLHRQYSVADGTSADEWRQVVPTDGSGNSLQLGLFPGQNTSGTFTVTGLPLGNYGDVRVILFDAASNFATTLLDTMVSGLNLSITTMQLRVTAPMLVINTESAQTPGADGSVHIPYTLKFPQSFITQYNGVFVLAKGSGGSVQPWLDISKPSTATGPDPYFFVNGEIVLPAPKSGIYSLQFGLFNYSWKLLQWIGTDFSYEIGGDAWVQKCPAASLPPRLVVSGGRWVTLDGQAFNWGSISTPKSMSAVTFVRGGDFGNAVVWTDSPLNNTPQYFALLRYSGLRWIRTNYDSDKYLSSPIYQHLVDQIVQNQLQGGLYPIIGPQGLPSSSQGTAGQIAQLVKLQQIIAAKYLGLPVWINLCNEPHELGDWVSCSAAMQSAASAVRAIDPNALITCPFEGYSKGSTANAAKAPIAATHIDLYDYHAYNTPDELHANLLPALAAGMPILVGEYGGGDGAYLHAINIALQQLSATYFNLLAAGPWAFTTPGQDSLPLVESVSGATLKFTPQGAQVSLDFNSWDAGVPISVPVPSPPPPPPPPPPPLPVILTSAQVRAIAIGVINARLAYATVKMKTELHSVKNPTIDSLKAALYVLVADLTP